MEKKRIDICFKDQHDNIRHMEVNIKEGTLLTFENVSNALYEEIYNRDMQHSSELKNLYEAVKAKYNSSKKPDARAFDYLPLDEQMKLGYDEKLLDYETIKVSAVIAWSLITVA